MFALQALARWSTGSAAHWGCSSPLGLPLPSTGEGEQHERGGSLGPSANGDLRDALAPDCTASVSRLGEGGRWGTRRLVERMG